VMCLPKCGRRGQTELMRVVVTLIGPDGTMRRRMVDTAASGDTGPWDELLARALASLGPYRADPGEAVCHLRVDDQVVLVAEHDLSGPLYDLVTEPFSSWDLPGLKDVDGLGQLAGLPGAAAELAQDVPGFSWALARSPGNRSWVWARLAAFCEAGLFRPRRECARAHLRRCSPCRPA
jgi:hypothetical protein